MRLRSVSRPCSVLRVVAYTRFAHVSFLDFFNILSAQTHAHLDYTLYSHHRNANVFHFIPYSADLGQVTNNSVTWKVSLPAYWTVLVSIEDANLDEGWSQAVSILHHVPSPLLYSRPLCLKPHLRFKFNQATTRMSAAYHPPSLPSPTPTRKYFSVVFPFIPV